MSTSNNETCGFSRRAFVSASAGTLASLAASGLASVRPAAAAESQSQAHKRTRRVGVAGISFRYAMSKAWKENSGLQFVEAAHKAGAEVAMLYPGMVDNLSSEGIKKLRVKAEDYNIMLETHGSDPYRNTYERTLSQSAALGVKTVGAYCGMLVRPDKAPTLQAWDEYMAKAEARFRELVPLAARQGINIAIENHLDFTIDELYNLVKKFDSPNLGVLFDIGNGIATMDDPTAAAELLGPYIMATHYKDFAIEEIARGFLFTMVPLGTGSLRLPEITQVLQKRVRPEAGFSIEMMNGQQFEVKWLEDRFWVPYRDRTGRQVAATLRHIRGKAIDIEGMVPEKELEKMPHEEHVQWEQERATKCVTYLKDLLENMPA